MKKTLLTAGLIAFAYGAFAQFTANRLVVSQYSDAVSEVGKATAATLKEFPLSGTVFPYTSTYSLALPTTNTTGVNAFSGRGGAGTEGLITLSSNGSYLSLFGYNLTPGTTPAGAAPYEKRAVARIDASGNINTTTLVAGSLSNKVAQPRVAITDDGSGFWVGSSGTGGVRYVLLGATGTVPPANTASDYGADVTTTADLGAVRSLNIFNGQLYETTVGSKLHFASVTQQTNKLPKDLGITPEDTKVTALSGFDATTPVSPNQALILKSTPLAGAPDVIYIANDASNSIEKYVLVGTTWTAMGTVTTSAPVRAITGRIVLGTAYIYATTYTPAATAIVGPPAVPAVQAASTLISITDTAPLSVPISTGTNPPILLATAPADNAFKGVAFTPGTTTLTTLPIKLSSFTGKSALNGAQLSWSTSSEQNNNHFDILRSEDGKNFKKIDEVPGNQNSNAVLNYSYLDKNAAKGANYYKLYQVDNNGTGGEEFGPVVVTLNGQPAAISVFASKASGDIKVSVYANKGGDATLNIYDANGRVLASQKVSLQAGSNDISLNSQNAGAGLHIASLTVDGVTLTKKFIFQ